MLRTTVCVFLVLFVCGLILDAGAVNSTDFDCYPNNTIHFTNPDNNTYQYYRAFYNDGTHTNCTLLGDENGYNDIFFDCHGTAANITIYFSDRDLSNDDIIGGSGIMYSLQCRQIDDHNKTFTSDLVSVSVNHTVESSDPIYNITSNFFDSSNTVVTAATVGQDLTFTITGPINFQLLPLSCVASAGTATKAVITNGCTDDANLVSNFAEDNNTHTSDYDMTFHAFKFFDHDDLTLTCEVRVCVSGSGCGFTCGTRRRRRALPGPVQDDDDIKTTTIGRRLIIRDVLLGGSANINGSLGLTIATALLIAYQKI